MPRVSVVIPTYDRAETLPRAIDSALAQTVDDLEVIVVDDGSTDETRSILTTYANADSRVRPVIHGSNCGANVARNTGIRYARGEYVAFLDSDDEWHPAKLERQLAVLEARPDEWVGVYCDATFDLSGVTGALQRAAASVLGRADDEPVREGGEELIGAILADDVQPGAGSTLLVETAVARKANGFDETLGRFQDPEFCLRVLECGKLAHVDEDLVRREPTGHPPAAAIERASEQYLSTYEDAVERFEAAGYEIRASHRLILGKRYLSEGRFLRATRHLRESSASIRHVPGLCWTAGAGVRRRPVPTAATLAVLVGTAIVSWIALSSRSGRVQSDETA
ncbi:glycosyltransferase family 2 protein [Natrarchaeobius sp. A-rgal3]|uniref:glycosyltransferase family 2 protein n=1 Tax=Natrarchaeobius versutus TaxID=1679078 RepID=UPI0035105024